MNLPGIDSAGHGTGRSAVYDATLGRRPTPEIERFVAQQKALRLWDAP